MNSGKRRRVEDEPEDEPVKTDASADMPNVHAQVQITQLTVHQILY